MIEVIAAMDICNGMCVRLTQGNFDRRTVYRRSPVDTAYLFEDAGIKRLHVVDLDGARTRQPVNLSILEDIATKTSLQIDFGGGIASHNDLKRVYSAGASIAVIGSVAITQPHFMADWLREYGGDRILLGVDIRGGFVSIHGWNVTTILNAADVIRMFLNHGLTQYFCTDITQDGTLAGPTFEIYRQLVSEFPHLKLIASGGISSNEDITALSDIGCSGVILGKAIYEGRIPLDSLSSYLTISC